MVPPGGNGTTMRIGLVGYGLRRRADGERGEHIARQAMQPQFVCMR